MLLNSELWEIIICDDRKPLRNNDVTLKHTVVKLKYCYGTDSTTLLWCSRHTVSTDISPSCSSESLFSLRDDEQLSQTSGVVRQQDWKIEHFPVLLLSDLNRLLLDVLTQGHVDRMYGCCRHKRCAAPCLLDCSTDRIFVSVCKWKAGRFGSFCRRTAGRVAIFLSQRLLEAESSEALVTYCNRCVNLIAATDWRGLRALKCTAAHK